MKYENFLVVKFYPDPNVLYPLPGTTKLVFLKNIITHPRITVRDDTCYDDPKNVHKNMKTFWLWNFIQIPTSCILFQEPQG